MRGLPIGLPRNFEQYHKQHNGHLYAECFGILRELIDRCDLLVGNFDHRLRDERCRILRKCNDGRGLFDDFRRKLRDDGSRLLHQLNDRSDLFFDRRQHDDL